jgi:hypothetical protein
MSTSQLQLKLTQALADPGAILEFYNALLENDVFVSGRQEGKGNFAASTFEVDGNVICPFS